MRVKLPRSALLEESIAIIRDRTTPPSDFRAYLRRIGRYLIYEASKNFELKEETVETPLTTARVKRIKHDIVIISVLRAALPMVDAIFEEFTNAALGVASASRGKMLDDKGTSFEIKSDYMKIPQLNGKIVVLVDPMLATASTINFILDQIKIENPHQIFLLSAIASEYGITQVEQDFPAVSVFAAAIDPGLNSNGYIVPGLGDAGDRACNTEH